MNFSRWEIFALGAAVFAGFTTLFGKLGMAQVNSNVATFLRVWVVLIFVGLVLCWRQQWQLLQTINNKAFILIILSGVTTALSWLCYYRALELGPISKVSAIDKLSIAVAILLGVIFLGEKFSLATALGSGLIIAGTLIVILQGQ